MEDRSLPQAGPSTCRSQRILCLSTGRKTISKSGVRLCEQKSREHRHSAEGRRKPVFRGLSIGIYTRPLFATKGEEENLGEILKLPDEEQDLVGIVLYGDNKQVDKAIDGLKLHP
jgi:hypothetical protein